MVSSEVDGLDGRIETRSAQDERIVVPLGECAEERTHTSSRVGTFGDEKARLRVLERIRAHLGS